MKGDARILATRPTFGHLETTTFAPLCGPMLGGPKTTAAVALGEGLGKNIGIPHRWRGPSGADCHRTGLRGAGTALLATRSSRTRTIYVLFSSPLSWYSDASTLGHAAEGQGRAGSDLSG